MRNVLKEDKEGFSKIDWKQQRESSVKNPEVAVKRLPSAIIISIQKNIAQVKQLKRDHRNLKQTLEN